jgi:hypothetical protein
MAGATLFFKLSIRWPYIIAFWYKKEEIFLYFPYKDTGKGLAKRIKTTAFSILGFALSMFHTWYNSSITNQFSFLVEHSLYLLSGFYSMHIKIKECNITGEDVFSMFFKAERFHLFTVLPYNFKLVPVLEVSLNQNTMGTTTTQLIRFLFVSG